jgi:hypothetical protein
MGVNVNSVIVKVKEKGKSRKKLPSSYRIKFLCVGKILKVEAFFLLLHWSGLQERNSSSRKSMPVL